MFSMESIMANHTITKINPKTTTKTYLFSALMLISHTTLANATKNAPVIEKRGLTSVVKTPEKEDVQTSTEWQLYQKILELDEEITQLRDKVERMEVALSNAKKEQDKRLNTADQRMENQESALIEVVDRLDAGGIPTLSDKEDKQENKTKADTKADNIPKKPKPANAQYAKAVDEDAAKKAYLAAYQAFKTKGTKAGVINMNKFINTYQKSKLVPSAHYWVGEFYLADSKPDLVSAELRFATVVKQYPKSAKVPKALYRLGNIAKIKNNNQQAIAYMQQIITQHPNAREVGLARAFLKQLKK